MRKFIPITFVFIAATTLTAGSSSVFAQDTSAATVAPTTGSASSAISVSSTKDFQERKTKILKHISDRLTKIQQIQSCVQAANDLKTLRACRPHRGDKEHSGK